MAQRPRGTVTFLFTDVEGSTRLLKQLRDRYGAVLGEHQRLLRDAFAGHGGEEVDTQGDAFFYVFSRARDAAAAAADGQRALASHAWPEGAELRVRMGLHTGEPVVSDEGRYHGMGVHRTARIMAAGHGGQILASQSTASVLSDDDLDGVTLRDLGEHSLKDIARPERIYELQVEGLHQVFAPLKTEGPAVVPPPLYRRPVVIGAFAGVLAAAIAIPVFAFGGGSGGSSLTALSANSVGVVNPASGAIDDEISDVPTPTRVAASDDAIWVTSTDTNSVSRIDATSHELRNTIRVGDGPSGIAYGAGDVWVANTLAGTVSRIDPDANSVVGEPIRVGNNPTAVAFGEGAVWVTNVDDQSVSRIDPKSGEVETFDVGAAGRGVAVGGGSVWIGDSAENRVVRVDAKTNAVTQAIGVGSGPSALAFGAGALWVANTLDGTVSRIDPESGQVRATVPVGANPSAIAASGDAVWVSNEAGRTIVRLDPRSGAVAKIVDTGVRPTGLTIAGSLWVAGQAAAGAHRGGTLRVVGALGEEQEQIDPAKAYGGTGWNILGMTNDGLVSFKRAGGGAGTQIVPDLATSVPAPTDDGRTYTFHLRMGIRFSNGATLKASDVRSTFERLFTGGTARPDYYALIRGASACAKKPTACDLSDGIVTDDKSGTVTFHLTAPNGEFLSRLAVPFASILPSGTPVSKRGTRPVPATGPYVIQTATPKRMILVRNRNFHVWDAVSTPDGYVDRIELSGDGDRQATAAIARGTADIANGFGDEFGARLAEFEREYPAQVHTSPTLATLYWFLNTTVAPFDDVRARRAVSFALDRARLLRRSGQVKTAQITCQVLPPNLPGYRPYCPYTSDPGAGGAWTAPDLAKARALVRQSGTYGARVTFWTFKNHGKVLADAGVARETFTQLGYRYSEKIFPDGGLYYEALAKAPKNEPNSGTTGWLADYPAAANFFEPMSCATFGDAAANSSRFCSAAFDRKLERANAVQTRDPGAAAKLWGQIDRDATDQAIWASLFTPRDVNLVSKRVGNYQHHPLFGVLLDQLWVR
ncbi:MAG: ABC transporter substrate-binding protein [Actinomycetota bacterium]